jgi:fumarylacetoacetate (FAA) hydrolase
LPRALVIEWNGKRFGRANGGAMDVGFHDLVAHADSAASYALGFVARLG